MLIQAIPAQSIAFALIHASHHCWIHLSVMVESISSWFHFISIWVCPQLSSPWLPLKGSDIIPKQQFQTFFIVIQTLYLLTHSPLTHLLPHWKNWWDMVRVIFAVLRSYSVYSHTFSSIGPPPLFTQINNFTSAIAHHAYLLFKVSSHVSTYFCYEHLENVLYINCLNVIISQWIPLWSEFHSHSSPELVSWQCPYSYQVCSVLILLQHIWFWWQLPLFRLLWNFFLSLGHPVNLMGVFLYMKVFPKVQ